jgi:hypothetical protein
MIGATPVQLPVEMSGLSIWLLIARSLISPCDNVAFGAAVNASGEDYPGCEAEQAVDGIWDFDCGWASNGLQHLDVDTGDLHVIDRVLVGPYAPWQIPNDEYYYYDAEWNIIHSTDAASWSQFEGVTKLQGAGDLGPVGIAISNGDPGTAANDPAYKVYEFTVTPTELRYVRISIVVGDEDSDSEIEEIELCAAPASQPDGGDDGGAGDGDTDDGGGAGDGDADDGGDPNVPGSHGARCARGQYFDFLTGKCETPEESSCRASYSPLATLLAALLVVGRRSRFTLGKQ